MTQRPLCVLCNSAPAELYCKNDDANLCAGCDASFHSSNPLAARHERVPLPACCHPDCSSSAPAGPCSPADCDSDLDLAVVPELSAGAAGCALALPSLVDDGLLGLPGMGPGTSGAFSAEDLLDFSGPALLDFDLQDLLVDFVVPGGEPAADALVPCLDAPAAVPAPAPQQQQPEVSLLGAAASSGLPASTLVPQATLGLAPAAPQDAFLHMVPQMPPAGAPAYSQLIPVPSVSAAPKVKAEQQAAAKQEAAAAAAAAAAAKHIVAEVPLTRAERVARYLEKKKRRNFKKVIRYQSRKAYAEVRPRIKGRFATPAEVAALKAAEAAKLAAQQEMDDVAVVPAC